MQFSIFLTGLVSVLASTTVALKIDLRGIAARSRVIQECITEKDCCFSTIGACRRQAYDLLESQVVCPLIDLCPSLGVSVQDCNADCCAISTKWGRGCPGK